MLRLSSQIWFKELSLIRTPPRRQDVKDAHRPDCMHENDETLSSLPIVGVADLDHESSAAWETLSPHPEADVEGEAAVHRGRETLLPGQ